MKPLVSFAFIACFSPLFAQQQFQDIKGIVLDKDTREPLVGVTIFVEEVQPLIGTFSDAKGRFVLEKVPLGRRVIKGRFPDYLPFATDLILSAGKEGNIEMLMQEGITETTTDEVVITATEYPSRPVNDMNVVSTRSFSAEETERYPASVNDPGRMALSFPGVQQGDYDARNDIIIRGNTPSGMIWRLEGIDIPSPNHYAQPGTSGGGITVFSAQLLARSDFSMGAFPAEYGNALSGVMDVHFRKGNPEKREYRIKAGMLGLDFSTEGPIQKGRSSYLVNYRYSTLGLLNNLGFHLVGERVDDTFQDLSFNLAFNSADGKGIFTVFGMGGLSHQHNRPVADYAARNPGIADEWQDREYISNMAANGITYTRRLDSKSYFKAVMAVSGNLIIYEDDTLGKDESSRFRYNTEKYVDQRVSTALSYHRKVTQRLRIKTGLQAAHIMYSFFRESAPTRLRGDLTSLEEGREVEINGQGNTQLLQAYVQGSYLLSEKMKLTAGLHSMFLVLNQSKSLEPRIGLQYKIHPKHSISLAFGQHSQMLPLGTYFYRFTPPNQPEIFPNLRLDFIRARHYVASYQALLGKGLQMSIEMYYQQLWNVPISKEPASSQDFFWMLNRQNGYTRSPLINKGRGTNYGLDMALEKTFENGWYFLLTASRFKSTYDLPNGRRLPTRYSTEYISSATTGVEINFSNSSILQIGTRAIYNGGFRYTPADLDLSREAQGYIADAAQAWSAQVKPYFRWDARISYRWNKAERGNLLSLDVQNLTNRKNIRGIGYDFTSNETYQINHPGGFIPVLSYQIDF